MKGPIVSIDVSNGNSHFQCFTQRGTKMGKVHRISHTVEGFNFLKSKIEELEKKTNEEVVAVYEATGVYTKPLERFLEKNEIKQYSISPLQSAKQRKTEIHNKKTDKVLVGEIHKIDGYLEQILYYIRSENTQNDYIIKEVDLNKVIREVMLKNKDVLLEKQIEIISDVGKLKVLTDYKWLEFMMNQIISNSIKYMKDGLDKKIEIKAYHKEQQIILEILDNGMGIPKSDLGRVFKKTFTGQNGRKVPGSTGMGLYIVDQLCKKLGHKLEIESKEGEYTKVIIVFDENLFYKEVRNME